MKIKKVLFYSLMLLPLIATCTLLFFLPDKIPAHWGTNGVVNRWGSKYETLILPVFIVLFGFLYKALGKFASKYEKNGNNNNEKVILIIGIASLLLFNVLTFYFLFAAFKQVVNLSQISVDLYSLIFAVTGIILIIVGNIMPKCKLNSIVGLRTTWSMKNERAWALSQRFGGIGTTITGGLMVLGNLLFFKGESSLIFSMIVLTIDVIISVAYTYHASKISERI